MADSCRDNCCGATWRSSVWEAISSLSAAVRKLEANTHTHVPEHTERRPELVLAQFRADAATLVRCYRRDCAWCGGSRDRCEALRLDCTARRIDKALDKR